MKKVFLAFSLFLCLLGGYVEAQLPESPMVNEGVISSTFWTLLNKFLVVGAIVLGIVLFVWILKSMGGGGKRSSYSRSRGSSGDHGYYSNPTYYPHVDMGTSSAHDGHSNEADTSLEHNSGGYCSGGDDDKSNHHDASHTTTYHADSPSDHGHGSGGDCSGGSDSSGSGGDCGGGGGCGGGGD